MSNLPEMFADATKSYKTQIENAIEKAKSEGWGIVVCGEQSYDENWLVVALVKSDVSSDYRQQFKMNFAESFVRKMIMKHIEEGNAILLPLETISYIEIINMGLPVFRDNE